MYHIARVCVNSHGVSWLRASTQPTCENPIVTRFHTLGKNFAQADRALKRGHGCNRAASLRTNMVAQIGRRDY
jgi:hypothetical protein